MSQLQDMQCSSTAEEPPAVDEVEIEEEESMNTTDMWAKTCGCLYITPWYAHCRTSDEHVFCEEDNWVETYESDSTCTL